MLKFIKHHMASIDGIEIYPLISFTIFFLFFIVVGYYTFTTPKKHINKMKAMPLDGQNQ